MEGSESLKFLCQPRRDGFDEVMGEIQTLEMDQRLETFNLSDSITADVQLSQSCQMLESF